MCPSPSEPTRQVDALRSAAAQSKAEIDDSMTAAVQMDSGAENKSGKGCDERAPGDKFGALDGNDGARSGDGDPSEIRRTTEARDKGAARKLAPVADAIRTTAAPAIPPSQTTAMAKADGHYEASHISTGDICSPATQNMRKYRELPRAREHKQQAEMQPVAAVAAAGAQWRDLRGDTVTALVRQLAR